MKKLLPTLRLSLDMTNVLAKIEHAGIKINLNTLDVYATSTTRVDYD